MRSETKQTPNITTRYWRPHAGIHTSCPIKVNGEVVGAIGLSGAPTVQNDFDCARAALALVPDSVPAEYLRADVRLEDDVRSLVDKTVTRFGRLDVAVNTAGTEASPAR